MSNVRSIKSIWNRLKVTLDYMDFTSWFLVCSFILFSKTKLIIYGRRKCTYQNRARAQCWGFIPLVLDEKNYTLFWSGSASQFPDPSLLHEHGDTDGLKPNPSLVWLSNLSTSSLRLLQLLYFELLTHVLAVDFGFGWQKVKKFTLADWEQPAESPSGKKA